MATSALYSVWKVVHAKFVKPVDTALDSFSMMMLQWLLGVYNIWDVLHICAGCCVSAAHWFVAVVKQPSLLWTAGETHQVEEPEDEEEQETADSETRQEEEEEGEATADLDSDKLQDTEEIAAISSSSSSRVVEGGQSPSPPGLGETTQVAAAAGDQEDQQLRFRKTGAE